ncbi:alpha-soluble NSF attachment protein [Sorghum bicolor]|uniref:alpha-soluble NSF attachment protein n=1 Tax=Sorghum bicolor TaxID=4558 RepID=UPI000B423934|nr:alpha-soluble NSF attachment protein [Sorghum bicolor]|eukprot:XP_021307851.1 alpha-soluble NSF attachment protein [Sorghum bicolor]
MGDHVARCDDFEKKAEEKLSGWGLFSSKYEDTANLFDKAANSFKLAKNWSKLQRGKTEAAGLKQLGTCLSLERHYALRHVLVLQV